MYDQRRYKKALELCTNDEDCEKCPYCDTGCTRKLRKDSFALIIEQDAEIERLKEVIKNYKEVLCETTQRKDDAIKRNDAIVEEYENKIKQLKAEFKQLETNAEILAWGVRHFNHENYELTEKVKQSQIDVLNKVKTLIFQKDNPYNVPFEEFVSSNVFCGYIDELINEVENE